MTAEPVYERRGELIRAPIRTALGNVVMRWVRPDNANIVVERRPAEPAKEVPPPPPAKKMYEYCSGGIGGCCGATYFRAIDPPVEEEWSDERIKAAWEKAWGSTFRLYERYVQSYGAGSRDGQYYADMAKAYSLESWTIKKKYLESRYGRVIYPTVPHGQGITVSPTPFDGYTLLTPAGWYLRCDRPPVNNKTDEAVEPNEKPTFKKGGTRQTYAVARQAFTDDKMSWHLTGMLEGQHSGYSMMAACKMAKVPTGAKVIAIFNQGQHNSNGTVTPRSVAAAGFRLVMKTGNHNHPGHSTLYIYERVIQEGDYDEIE